MSFTTHNASMRIQAVAAILEGRPMKTLTMGRFFSRQFVYTMYNIYICIIILQYISIHIWVKTGYLHDWVVHFESWPAHVLMSSSEILIVPSNATKWLTRSTKSKHKHKVVGLKDWLVYSNQQNENTNCLTLKMTLAPNWTPTWSCINMYNSILNQVNTHQSSFIRTFPTSGPQKGEVILRYR